MTGSYMIHAPTPLFLKTTRAAARSFSFRSRASCSGVTQSVLPSSKEQSTPHQFYNSVSKDSILHILLVFLSFANMAEIKSSPTEEDSILSKEYENPLDKPETAYINSFTLLKERIKHHYEICSEYYLSLWLVT